MKLTPLDIRRQQFTKAFRGYEPAEVDAFLKQISDQQEKMLDQVRQAQDRTREMEAKLAHYERVELALQEALESSKESARRAEASAKEKAKIIIEQAELEARSMLHDAERERYGLRQDLVQLSSRQTEVAARLRGFLLSELEVLAQFQGDDPSGYRRLGGGTLGALPPGPPAPEATREPAYEPPAPPPQAPPEVIPEAPATEAPEADGSSGEATEAPPILADADAVVDAQLSASDLLPADEVLPDADAATEIDDAPEAETVAEPMEWHAPDHSDDAPLPVDPEPPPMTVDDLTGGFADSEPVADPRETAPPVETQAEDVADDADGEETSDGSSAPLTLGGWDLRSLVTGEERSNAASEADRERIRRILDDLD